MDIKCILYISRETRTLPRLDFRNMVHAAAVKNATLGISGFLTYFDGKYFQYIEGTQHRLDSIYEKIVIDDRHKILAELSYTTTYKECNDWNMLEIPSEYQHTHFGHIAETILMLGKSQNYSYDSQTKLAKELIANWITSYHNKQSTS